MFLLKGAAYYSHILIGSSLNHIWYPSLLNKHKISSLISHFFPLPLIKFVIPVIQALSSLNTSLVTKYLVKV